jgi:hypothetical protein
MANQDDKFQLIQGTVVCLTDPEQKTELVGVVVSHDCDICASSKVEPYIEVVQADFTKKQDGNLTFGKNPRILQLEIRAEKESKELVTFDIRSLIRVQKESFFHNAKPYRCQLISRDIVVLRRWMAARYGRSAFPGAFEDLLRNSVFDKLEKLASAKGKNIRALYFDLDNNQLIERKEGDDPYELAIYVVHPSDTDNDEAASFASDVASIFRQGFFKESTHTWEGVRLLSCDSISEDTFTLELANNTKPWRLDHRSYGSLPDAGVFPNPAP